MKVAFVIGNITRLAGGVSEALIGLTRALRSLGVKPIVVTRIDQHFEEDRGRFGDIEIFPCAVTGPARYPIVRGLQQALAKAQPDVVHLHGIWSYEGVAVRSYARRAAVPYVVSPHGMLDPWILAKSRRLKQLLYAINERRLLSEASIVHALSPSEAASIEALRLPTPLAQVPNGVEIDPSAGSVSIARERLAESPRRFVYLGRIDPKKNIHGLLEGWRLFRARVGPEARLDIAGWGPDGYRSSLAEGDGVRFVGPLYNGAKAEFLRNAHFLVLPSFSEGFPMVPLEGWAQGTPAILSRHCNMDFAFDEGIALRCGTDASEIADALDRAYRLDPREREASGRRGRAMIERDFSWRAVAETWLGHYRAAAGHVE